MTADLRSPLLALLLPLLAPPTAAQTGQGEKVAPIQAEGDFYVLNFSENAENVPSLQDFVDICQEATGRQFIYDDQTKGLLVGRQVFMHGTKRIPKADFYAFFQILMFINDFVCVEVGPSPISVVNIQSTTQGQRVSGLKQKAVYVLPEDLEDYADQPATLITTVLNLPNTDTRQLSTSLRGLMTDTNTQTLIAPSEHSVILQGFGSYIYSLAQLLYIVDREAGSEGGAEPVFEVIPLEYAAAEDVADLIDQLVDARDTGMRRNRRNRPSPEQGVSAALPGGDVETQILVDARTNSLLVMALPDEIPSIKDLVAQLDVDVIEPERNYHIYRLQNVQAADIADVLDQFLQDAERIAAEGASGAPGRPGSQVGGVSSSSRTQEVVVVPDEASNSLLVAANKTRYEEILELLAQLDERQDQVLIETALIELSGTDFRSLGVEWALADVMGDGGFGATRFGLSTFTDSNGDGVPDLRVPVAADGITAGILSGDDVNLPFLVQAVERIDGANVLNVPSVLVNNNGSARVVTLDEQPTTTITATGGGVGAGQTQENFNGFQEAGITLQISPSISAARYLRLNISLVVSNFTGSFSANSTIPPPRVTREIETMVNVPDGDTMVIGGIVTDNQTDSSTGVPWISRLPILGHLFKASSKTNTRTTLYFFVTPHIMRDRDFADLAKISYETKLQAAEVIGADRVRKVDPKFGQRDDAIDFEGFQVPLYRSPAHGEVPPESVGLTPERRRELLEQRHEEPPPQGQPPQQQPPQGQPEENPQEKPPGDQPMEEPPPPSQEGDDEDHP